MHHGLKMHITQNKKTPKKDLLSQQVTRKKYFKKLYMPCNEVKSGKCIAMF